MGMIMAAEMKATVLTMREAGAVLFGESSEKARKRAAYLLKTQGIKTIKNGKQTLVRRDVLQKEFGIDYQGKVTPLDLERS
jgi:hypothetical protein